MIKKSLIVIANNNLGYGLSGGDRISVNLIKNWQSKLNISAMGSAESRQLFEKYSSLPSTFIQIDQPFPLPKITTFRFVANQIKRTCLAIYYFFIHFNYLKTIDFVYTVSDFYPDLIVGLLYKLFLPKTIWIAGYYLFAPNPTNPHSHYNQNDQTLRGWLYFLGQIPTKFIVKLFANYVFVTSDPDINQFISHHLSKEHIFVVQGGVDPVNFSNYQKSKSYIKPPHRPYDAVYLGRFHSQKGVIELVHIWQLVTQTHPQAKLIMIGNGELVLKVKRLIKKNHLTKNIILTGFMDGPDKIKIFQNSKIVVHPAIYDSGGMAAAEAMAWGLPGVSFDLESLKTYYPYGMLKSKSGSLQSFADNIILLLNNPKTYQETSSAALRLIKTNWIWSSRFEKIYQKLSK